MNNELYRRWKNDEQAEFTGWDFSYLENRMKQASPPWDYKKLAKKLLKNSKHVLDLGTGGGEIFASLKPLPKHARATEAYPPNVKVARRRLKPLGVNVVQTSEDPKAKLPFKNEEFDLVLNRHEAYSAKEVYRILKPGGFFLTQQVDGNDCLDLLKAFKARPKWSFWNLKFAKKDILNSGFVIKQAKNWTGSIIFKEVGAVVYYLKAIPWYVDDFSVDKCLSNLEKLQTKLDKDKKLQFAIGRFLILAWKPDV